MTDLEAPEYVMPQWALRVKENKEWIAQIPL